jgi:uncharacterized protein YegL
MAAVGAWAQDGIGTMDLPKRRPAEEAPQVSQPLTVIFVCDRSGSMKDNRKMDELNDALQAFFRDLRKNPTLANNLRIGIVDFASDARVSRQPAPLGLTGKAPRFQPDGGTNMAAALREARALAQSIGSGELQPIVILLTDGEPDSKGDTRREADMARQVAHLYALGVNGADFAFLEEVAGDAAQTAALQGTQFESFFKDMTDALQYHIMASQQEGTRPRTFSIQNKSGWKLE